MGRTARLRRKNKYMSTPAPITDHLSEVENNVCDCSTSSESRKKLSKTKYSLTYEDKFIKLHQWMTQRGFDIRKHHLKPAAFTETGRGMMTTRKLNSNDLIIAVPEHLLITTRIVTESYLSPILLRLKEKLSPIEALAMFLLCEKHRGDSSPWQPYINVLPASYTTPVHWTTKELKQLPQDVLKEANKQRNNVRRSFMKLSREFIPLLDIELPQYLGCVSEEDYTWAWSSINTRCVYMQQEENDLLNTEKDHYALAPFLDLLNHSPQVQVEAGFDKHTHTYCIHSITPSAKFSEVFICYGAHSNADLLVEYGFIVPDNLQSSVPFSLKEILAYADVEGLKLMEKKCVVMEEFNLSMGLFCNWEGMSWCLLSLFRLLAMNHTELLDIGRRPIDQPVSERNEAAMKRLATKFLQKHIARLPLCNESDVTENMQLASALCEEYRQILASCIQGVT